MGSRGPAPMPTEQLKARGSWKANERVGEVQFEKGRPTCPGFLVGEAKHEWTRQIEQLDAAGILQVTDRAMLAAWCEAWGEFVELTKTIRTKVESAEATGFDRAYLHAQPGYKELVKSKNAAVERMLKLAQQFGFSPSARTRIKGEGHEDAPDPLQVFINNGESA